MQRGSERGTRGTQRTRPPRAPSTVASTVHWCPDLGGARPPGVAAMREVLRHRQRTTVAFRGWRGGRGWPGKRQFRHRGAWYERTVRVVPLRQVSDRRTQRRRDGRRAGSQSALNIRLGGRAELPITGFCGNEKSPQTITPKRMNIKDQFH